MDTNQHFQDVYVQDSEKLGRFVHNRVKNEYDAEDLIQEVWTRFYQQLQKGQPLENDRAWLFYVARNLVTDYYRSQARRRQTMTGTELETLNVADPSENPVRAQEAQEIWDRVNLAASQLSDAHRQAFWETEVDGKSFKELADETGLNMGTLLSRKHYAVRALRKMMNVFYDEFKKSL